MNDYLIECEREKEDRDVLNWIRLGVHITILVTTVFGNLIVILCVLTIKVLQQKKNYLIVSLAIADLLVGSIVLPLKIILRDDCGSWNFGRIVCYIWGSGDIMLTTASILSMTLIALDRYFAISYPLLYKIHSTRRNGVIGVCTCWVLAFLLTVPHWILANPYQQFPTGSDSSDHSFLEMYSCTQFSGIWHQLLTVTISILIPMCIMIFIFCTIFRIVKRQKRFNLQRQERQSCRSSTNTKHLSDNFKHTKGIINLGILMVPFIICWLPLLVMLYAEGIANIAGTPISIPYWLEQLFSWLGYFNSCIDPIIYTTFNKDFRLVVKELLRFRGCGLNERIRAQMYSKQIGHNKVSSKKSNPSVQTIKSISDQLNTLETFDKNENILKKP